MGGRVYLLILFALRYYLGQTETSLSSINIFISILKSLFSITNLKIQQMIVIITSCFSWVSTSFWLEGSALYLCVCLSHVYRHTPLIVIKFGTNILGTNLEGRTTFVCTTFCLFLSRLKMAACFAVTSVKRVLLFTELL